VSFTLPVAAGLLNQCIKLPEQLPLQQRLLLMARCMVVVGRLIEQLFGASADGISALSEERLLRIRAEDKHVTCFTPESARAKLRALIATCGACMGKLGNGLKQVQLHGTAADAELVQQQLEELQQALGVCVLTQVELHYPALLRRVEDEEAEQKQQKKTMKSQI
jgi:hypothetical protein